MPGEPQIHQHDVWAHIDDDLDRVLSVGGLADELEAAAGERLRDRAADELLIVDQHDRNGPLELHAGAFFSRHDTPPGSDLLWNLPTPSTADTASRGTVLRS